MSTVKFIKEFHRAWTVVGDFTSRTLCKHIQEATIVFLMSKESELSWKVK